MYYKVIYTTNNSSDILRHLDHDNLLNNGKFVYEINQIFHARSRCGGKITGKI